MKKRTPMKAGRWWAIVTSWGRLVAVRATRDLAIKDKWKGDTVRPVHITEVQPKRGKKP